MTPHESQCRVLHALFEELTKQTLTLSYQRMQTWTGYLARGLSADDLRVVVLWLKTRIARGVGGFSRQSLQFGTLLADLDRFEDRLNTARACRRRKDSSKGERLRATAAPNISPDEEARLRAQRRQAMETLKTRIGR